MSRETNDDEQNWLGHSDPMKELGLTIKALREAKGLSQDELAAGLKVTRATVSGWEAGDYAPRGKRLRAIATALGVTVPELMSGRARATQRAAGTLIAVESNGDEVPVLELVSAEPKIWAKTHRRVILLEDKTGHRFGILATDETIQALESCLLALRELL
jgi:transcriptional regulator with XRE-family HTH domain